VIDDLNDIFITVSGFEVITSILMYSNARK